MYYQKRFSVLAILLLLLLVPQTTSAHAEGALQLASEPAGPFRLTVWTAPDPAEIGEVHVASSIVLAEDASPILGAEVQVEMSGQGATLSAPATAEDATNKFLYEAILFPDEVGSYQVEVTITDQGGATGSASFELQVVERRPALGTVMLFVVLVLLVVGGLAVWFLQRRPAEEATSV